MMTFSSTPIPRAFGLIIIGDELLIGTRRDAHFLHFRERLRALGHTLAWCWFLPDTPEVLIAHFNRSLNMNEPVFCCGGIGATPDDCTRECVARAAGVPLFRHQDAVQAIETHFGAAAYPHRVFMADMPQGSRLIPNSYNSVPGFSFAAHHFLPGFPQLAWPMAEWVLEHEYPGNAVLLEERAVQILDQSENALLPLMQRLTMRYPNLKLFSLPHIGARPSLELGFRGREGINEAFTELLSELTYASIEYHLLAVPSITKE